jgi:hypothetical protein
MTFNSRENQGLVRLYGCKDEKYDDTGCSQGLSKSYISCGGARGCFDSADYAQDDSTTQGQPEQCTIMCNARNPPPFSMNTRNLLSKGKSWECWLVASLV